jgi:hypothetical protein
MFLVLHRVAKLLSKLMALQLRSLPADGNAKFALRTRI